jgi:hypothetical protein
MPTNFVLPGEVPAPAAASASAQGAPLYRRQEGGPRRRRHDLCEMRSVVAGVGAVNKANSDLPPSLVIHQYSGGAVLDPSLTISEALT